MNENQIEVTMDGVMEAVSSEQKMNGFVVAGVAAGSTLIGGLLVWGIPKLINKIKSKKAVKMIEAKDAGTEEDFDEDDNK